MLSSHSLSPYISNVAPPHRDHMLHSNYGVVASPSPNPVPSDHDIEGILVDVLSELDTELLTPNHSNLAPSPCPTSLDSKSDSKSQKSLISDNNSDSHYALHCNYAMHCHSGHSAQSNVGNYNGKSQSEEEQSESNRRTKRRKGKRKKARRSGNVVGYDPSLARRAQGNIQISKSLTESIVSSMTAENISNIYSYMDKA